MIVLMVLNDDVKNNDTVLKLFRRVCEDAEALDDRFEKLKNSQIIDIRFEDIEKKPARFMLAVSDDF